MGATQATITGCILARNEEQRIEAALQSLQGWTEEIIVIDNESEDGTVAIARRYTECVLSAPRAANFDAARNLAIEPAVGGWLFFLDADERVPPRLGETLKRLVEAEGDEFEALLLPFKHYFCGKWMQHSGWWPGYTRPQLMKKGCFRYNERLHSGAEVQGRTRLFPADDPDLAIVHYSYLDLQHYLEKLNRYTDGEAESLLTDGGPCSWQAMTAHFVHDWQEYYERHRADLDGMHGWTLAFMSAFYRFASRAKLWDLRQQRGEVSPQEPVPADLREVLNFMAQVAQQGAKPWLVAPAKDPGAPAGTADPSSVSKPEGTPADRPTGPQPGLGEPGTDLPRISALVLARNEERRLPRALASLQGWVSQILLLDHGSTDRTAEVARGFGAEVIPLPFDGARGPGGSERGASFDTLRGEALPHVTGDWVLVVDADEQIPPELATEYLRRIREEGDQFEGLVPPFRNYFCGHWIRGAGWWPGYVHLQLLKTGHFQFNGGVHGGISVAGRTVHLPPDPEDASVIHHTCDDLRQYMEKLNRYTDAEAASLLEAGANHGWQAQLAHFTNEWRLYYEVGRADRDGMYGFVLSFLSAFYRLTARAKLWDLRRQRGEVDSHEPVPPDLRTMLQFMAQCLADPDYAQRCFSSHASDPATDSPTRSPEPVSLPGPRVPLLWRAPLLDPSGYADEARQFVLGLVEGGQELVVHPEPWGGEAELPEAVRALLRQRTVPVETTYCDIQVFHTLPGLQAPSPLARFNIARTMFETDRIPGPFVERLNQMDRVWVPSEFNRETFTRSGVHPDRIAVVPGALDVAPFTTNAAPWPLPGADLQPEGGETRSPYTFLSVFDWTLHKGWDVLLEAFVREFGADPTVRLVVKTWSSHHYTLEDIRAQADGLLRQRLGRGLSDFPNLHLWQQNIPTAELPRLYRAADAFVLPTRGEGWCRPLMEAMAAGLPTIATAWSGLTEFHNDDVGYPLRYQLRPVPEAGAREIPIYGGHCWAEPDLAELQRLMRRLLEKPKKARKRGQAAQQHIERRYSRAAVAARVQAELNYCRHVVLPAKESAPGGAAVPRDQGGRTEDVSARPAVQNEPRMPKANLFPREPAAPVDFRAPLGRPLRVRWEGDQALLSSLGLVNRELCLGLLAGEDVELSLGERTSPWHTLTPGEDPRLEALFARRGAALSGPPDVTIRHHFPPCWERPATGKLIVIQPWEYGHLPVEWVQGAIRNADEVWAYSRWVRDVYVRSGVPAEKVKVVPLGFNPQLFHPDGPALDLSHFLGSGFGNSTPNAQRPTPRTRFLFVGGALDRKGADLLLQAYLQAFTPADDVALIVKDMGTRTFYMGATLGDAYRQAQSDPRCPEVRYLDQDLTEVELAALYRSCTCVVQPYRGEGFALPPLEGMASGRMPIVTAGGPTDDYVDDGNGIRLPYRKRLTGGTTGGTFPCAGDPWQLEPDLGALIGALRWVYEHPEEAKLKGESAATSVGSAWSWESAANLARHRLWEVVIGSRAGEVVPAQPWQSGAAK